MQINTERYVTEDEVIALVAALAGDGGGGGGTGDGDMKKSVYDSTEEVKDAGGIKNFVSDAITNIGLGDLATKDTASGEFTPGGSVSVSQGTDSTTTVNSITDVGTLPTITVDGEAMTITVGTLPTKGADTTVVTASGTRTATFSGTEGNVEVS